LGVAFFLVLKALGKDEDVEADEAVAAPPSAWDMVVLIGLLGMVFGYFAALPDLSDINEGVSWVWRRGLLWAAGTWLVGAVALVSRRLVKPRPNER
jgi:hypothetical protein